MVPVVQRILDDQQFRNAGDLDHYVSLLDKYPAFIAGMCKTLQKKPVARHRPAQDGYSR